MKEIDGIAHSVAHEIKNPLAIALQGVEYLKENLRLENENVSLILKYMGDSISRADNVVMALLEFASLSQFNMHSQDLNAIMEKTLSVMQIEFDRHQIKVNKRLAIDLPLLKIDNKRMEQVFSNILLNAVQAMPDGGTLSVETGLRPGSENNKSVFIRKKD